MGGLFIYKKLLILLLTLVFIFSLSSVSADDGVNVSPDENNSQELSVDNELYEINHPPKNHHLQPDLMPEKRSVSKNFDFFGLFDWFGGEKKHGYWVLSGDMNKVDFDKLSKNGVNIIFLNSYAFTEHGQRDVLDWIKQANDHGIEVHIWMQIFYTGKWISPLKNGTPDTQYFNYKIEEAKYYAGLQGVSGLQMDYIRFEGDAYKYPNGTKAITQFVETFSKKVKEVNPSLTVSATVMPEGDKDAYYYGQDIKAISKHVDVIVPMMYKGNYKEDSDWIKDTTRWFVYASGNAKIWIGLQTYQSDFNVTDLPADELITDGKYAFDNGAKGVIYFRWGMNEELENRKIS